MKLLFNFVPLFKAFGCTTTAYMASWNPTFIVELDDQETYKKFTKTLIEESNKVTCFVTEAETPEFPKMMADYKNLCEVFPKPTFYSTITRDIDTYKVKNFILPFTKEVTSCVKRVSSKFNNLKISNSRTNDFSNKYTKDFEYLTVVFNINLESDENRPTFEQVENKLFRYNSLYNNSVEIKVTLTDSFNLLTDARIIPVVEINNSKLIVNSLDFFCTEFTNKSVLLGPPSILNIRNGHESPYTLETDYAGAFNNIQ